MAKRKTVKRRLAPIGARVRRAERAFGRLVRTMDTLRSANGCPWDRKQTPETLRPFLLEETYEALETIDRGDLDGLRGELGDVLFQCVFQSQIAVEAGRFEIADAVNAVTEKLIRRHPHVFTPAGRPLTGARPGMPYSPATGFQDSPVAADVKVKPVPSLVPVQPSRQGP